MWNEDKEGIERVIMDYFTSIYRSDQPSSFEDSLSAITNRVSTDMNAELIAEFRAEEVWNALQQLHPTKSPGPDGISPIFFKNYWDIVGVEVVNCVLNALNSGSMPCGINDTFICFIPKVKSPQKITEFRPISLCNVIYKIMSKILANRLKRILLVVIDESQSAFVPGRLITDNVLVAFETLHCINQRNKGKEALVAIKLDMSKAYDRVELAYLEAMMRKMGFHEKWISLIMMCVTTVSFSVLINNEPKGKIIPTKGLRQGDLISLYLFLLCVEGLSAMLKREEKVGHIKEVAVSRGAPRISHLLFADDSIVFCRATVEECGRVIKVLEDYEGDSGQKLNKEKTSLFFSKNTNREVQKLIKEKFGAQIVQHHKKFLGLPTLVGKSKRKSFNCIKDLVGRKIAGWKGRLLSHAGREILIKIVA